MRRKKDEIENGGKPPPSNQGSFMNIALARLELLDKKHVPSRRFNSARLPKSSEHAPHLRKASDVRPAGRCVAGRFLLRSYDASPVVRNRCVVTRYNCYRWIASGGREGTDHPTNESCDSKGHPLFFLRSPTAHSSFSRRGLYVIPRGREGPDRLQLVSTPQARLCFAVSATFLWLGISP